MGFRLAILAFPAVAVSAAACSSSPEMASAKASARSTTMDAGVEAGPSTLSNGCPLNSGFVGDDMCLVAPAATDGIQLHYGPKNYADPAEVQPFVLAPGGETNDCYYEKTPNTTDRYVSGFDINMRPGSHHMFANVNPMPQADGFAVCGPNDSSGGILWGSQTPTEDDIKDPAPENQGLAAFVPANSQAVINFHVVNATGQPLLREVWLNYFYIDASKVTGLRGNVLLYGGLGFQIAPGTNTTYQYSCSPERPVRILSLASHMHAHATRLTMWKVSGGQPTLIYENYSWQNPINFNYDSAHPNNPTPDRATQTPGATSGQLVLQPTDTLQWECAIDNTSDVTLTFRNEVYTGEMCVVAGTMVPTDDPMNHFDFTCGRN
jgi:hypothetical protein